MTGDHRPVEDRPGEDLIGEILEEARHRRESGDIPRDLEDDLDRLFESLVPDATGERDFVSALERAERDALIDVNPPTESDRAVLQPVKRGIKKLVLWYMDYVVGQVVTLAGSLVRAVRLLGTRVDDLEGRLDRLHAEQVALRTAVLDPASGVAPRDAEAALDDPTVGWLVGALAGHRGRILHADAGTGVLVEALRAAGLDAYGVTSLQVEAEAETVPGLETAPARDHLDVVAPGALSALVLSGFVDSQSLAHQLDTARLAASALGEGGRLFVVGTHPSAWTRDRSPVEQDLSPGRPLHPDTWCHVLRSAGFSSAGDEPGHGEGRGRFVVSAVR